MQRHCSSSRFQVVTTGNKSEMSVGYATLYGDMNGGFNPIKDLYTMQVYALSAWMPKDAPSNMSSSWPPSWLAQSSGSPLSMTWRMAT